MTDESSPEREQVRPRWSGAVLASLLLVLFSIVGFAKPPGLGPLGPLGAGVLAFLGYRNIRLSKGGLRGIGLARVAMTASLVLLVGQAWMMWHRAPTSHAWETMRRKVTAVESSLRTGTAESSWDLLGAEARSALDREVWLRTLRDASADLGGLRTLGNPRESGGDWARTATFAEGESATMRLPMEFDAEFAQGRGLVRLEFLVEREGRAVTVDLVRLDVHPR